MMKRQIVLLIFALNLLVIEPSVGAGAGTLKISALAPKSGIEEGKAILRWRYPVGGLIAEAFLRLSEERGGIVDAEIFREELLKQGISEAQIAEAIAYLYRDPTQKIAFDNNIPSEWVRTRLTGLLRANASNLIGPAKEILIRKGLPGEADRAIVQLLGSRLVFTLFATHKANLAGGELSRLIPEVSREMVLAIKEERTLLGFDSAEVESFIRDQYAPFISRFPARSLDDSISEAEVAELNALLSALPLGSGIFARILHFGLSEPPKVRDINSLNSALNRQLFLPNGLYYRYDSGTSIKILHTQMKPYLGRVQEAHYCEMDLGEKISFAVANHAFIDIGRVLEWARKWASLNREEEQKIWLPYKEGAVSIVDDDERELADGFFDFLIGRLAPLNFEEEKRRILKDKVLEEERHAEDNIFTALIQGRDSKADPILVHEAGRSILRFGAVLAFQHLDLAPEGFPAVFETQAIKDFWHGMMEIRALLKRWTFSTEMERIILTDFSTYLMKDSVQNRPERLYYFWIIRQFFHAIHTHYGGDVQKALDALNRNPKGVLGSLFRFLDETNFYTEEERLRLLGAKSKMDRAQVILDCVDEGARIGMRQVEQFEPQFGMGAEEIVSLIRSRPDFVVEEGGFFVKRLPPASGQALEQGL